MYKFSIILVNYNNYKDSKDILYNLIEQDKQAEEVILVDNCSTDDSYKKLNKEFDSYNNIIIIRTDFNGGFSYANNFGIKHSMKSRQDIDYYMLLNNDTYVEKDFIETCSRNVRDDKNIGIYTGKILNYFNRDIIWYGGGVINKVYLSGLHEYEGASKDIPQANSIKEVEFASGCFMIIPRSIILDGHYLPEEYFLYYEDVDYSLLMNKLGLKIEYNPAMVVYHKISQTTKGNNLKFNFYFNRNRIILGRKYFSKPRVLLFVLLLVATRCILFFRILITKRRFTNVFSGIIKGLRFNIER